MKLVGFIIRNTLDFKFITISDPLNISYKGKGKIHHITGQENPEGGGAMYSSTLPSTPAVDGDGWSTPRPGRFTPLRTGTHSTEGCEGPRAGLDGCGKSRPQRDSFPGP